MSATFLIGASAASTDGLTVTTTGIDTTTATLIVAIVAGTAPLGVPSFSDNKSNTSWNTLSLHGAGTGPPQIKAAWCRPTTVGASHTFTADYGATFSYPGLTVLCFTGGGDWDNGEISNFTYGDVSLACLATLMPANADDIVIAAVGHGATVEAPSVDGGFSTPQGILGTAGSLPVWASYLIQTTPTAVNPTWTWTTSTSAVAMLLSFLSTTTVATTTYYLGSDITPGNWTTSTGSGTLTSMVDETTRSDTDYIQSDVNPTADLVELEWANVQVPSVNTDHTVSYVLKGDASCQAIVGLLAGDATTVTAWVHTALPPTFTQFDRTLSTAACDAFSLGGYPGAHLTVTAG